MAVNLDNYKSETGNVFLDIPLIAAREAQKRANAYSGRRAEWLQDLKEGARIADLLLDGRTKQARAQANGEISLLDELDEIEDIIA